MKDWGGFRVRVLQASMARCLKMGSGFGSLRFTVQRFYVSAALVQRDQQLG